MGITKGITLAVTLTVAIVMIAALVMPVVSNASSTEATIYNEGMRMSLYETGDTHTITFSDTEVITDGVGQPLPDMSVYGSALITYGYNAEGQGAFARLSNTYKTLEFWGFIGGTVWGNRGVGSFNTASITVDANGHATLANSGLTSRDIYNVVLYPDPNGDLVLTYHPYVLADSVIYGCGFTTVSGTDYGLSFAGTASSVTVTSMYPPQTFGNVTIDKTNTCTNLYMINTIDIVSETAASTFHYSYFVAPYSITYENPEYAGSTGGSVVLVIPTMLLVALLCMAVGVAVKSRAD